VSSSEIWTIVVAVFASVTAPILLALLYQRVNNQNREADYARQDEVARKAAAAAAEQATKAGQDEAAKLLEIANSAVVQTAAETNGKLDAIHVLVNSNMTAAMQSELDSIRRELLMMRQVLELKQAAGVPPTAEALQDITDTEHRVGDLAARLDDRHKAAMQIAAGESMPSKADEHK
jgi:hypothetical protein